MHLEQAMHGGEAATVSDLQQQLQLVKQELRQAQGMAALGELASTTTHEFNNALTTILNYAKLGLRHTDEATRTKALEKILSAGQRANKITNCVLGLARNRSDNPAPTDLAELIDETLVLLERELMKYRVSVERRFADVPRAMVVGNQIQQVLINLLTNARQAMPSGGQVALSLTYEAGTKFVELTVRDTGSGISADKLPKIFDRGFSTKAGPDASGKGGAGIGLAACREILEAHGGRVRVASTEGRGTAFTLKLPVATQAATNPSTQPVVSLGA